MKISLTTYTACAILFFAATPDTRAAGEGTIPEIDRNKKSVVAASEWLRNQPVQFLENKGQLTNSAGLPASNVLFIAEAPGVNMYVTDQGLTYVQLQYEKGNGPKPKVPGSERKKKAVSCERIDMILAGASIRKENVVKAQASESHSNFLYGPGEMSIYNVKKYAHITIRNVYPGIDWVLYNTSEDGFKYDFIVHPGADPGTIEMIYRSQNSLSKDEDGNLVLNTKHGLLSEKPPVSFTEDKKPVKSSYRLKRTENTGRFFESAVGFNVGSYDRAKTLVIDPVLLWATYYGGTSFEGTYCTDPDYAGNVYLCGYLGSNDFPMMDAGTFIDTTQGSSFIVKFTNDGTLLWSTYFQAQTTFLDTDMNNNLFVCGTGGGTNIPLTNAGTYYQGTAAGGQDAYICKFNSSGAVTWCTYYGGNGYEYASGISTDLAGNVYLTGSSSSTNLPVFNGGGYFESTPTAGNSGFIAKFTNSGAMVYATYLKNLGQPICTGDINSNVYLVGQTSSSNIPLQNPGGTSFYQGTLAGSQDGYFLKMSPNGTLLWGTYYGGSSSDMATSVQTDKTGNVFICGTTSSTNIPVLNAGTYFKGSLSGNYQDIFVLKFDNTATMKWGTYFGGTRTDMHFEDDNIAIDTCGNVFLAFTTTSRNVPFQQACDPGMFDNSIDTTLSTSHNNVYLARFTNAGDLMWSSLFGGDGNSFRSTLGADRFGNVFFSGEWNGVVNNASYPLMWPGGTTYTQSFMGYEDLYVAKFTNKPPVQTFSYAATCISNQLLPVSLPPGFITGGTFTASPGLSISPTTGDIYPSTSTPGTYTVNYMKSLCYCPGAVATIGSTTVSLLPSPILTISGTPTLCTGEKATYTLTGATSFTWHNATTNSVITITAPPTSTNQIKLTVTSTENPYCVAVKDFYVSVSKCLGVEEMIGDNHVSIFPNPNTGEFTIVSEKAGSYRLVSGTGQLIRRIEFNSSNSNKVEINDLAAGVYFLEGEGPKGKNSIKILVTD